MGKIIFFLAGLFVLQFSFLPFILPSIEINLLLLVCFLAPRVWREQPERNLFLVLSAGLLFDIFSVYPFGVGTFVFLIVGVFIHFSQKFISAETKPSYSDMLLILLSKILFDGFFFLLNYGIFFLSLNKRVYQANVFSMNYLSGLIIYSLIAFILLVGFLRHKRLQKNEIKIS